VVVVVASVEDVVALLSVVVLSVEAVVVLSVEVVVALASPVVVVACSVVVEVTLVASPVVVAAAVVVEEEEGGNVIEPSTGTYSHCPVTLLQLPIEQPSPRSHTTGVSTQPPVVMSHTAVIQTDEGVQTVSEMVCEHCIWPKPGKGSRQARCRQGVSIQRVPGATVSPIHWPLVH
jgi:hypothetical protein